MVLRHDDPEVWSYLNVPWRNSKEVEQFYRGIVRSIRDLCWDDWDFPILVCGREGSGKSAFALNLACDLDDDIIPHIEDHVLWNVMEDASRIEAIVKDVPPSVFVIDEAGVDLMSRNSMLKDQKRIIEMFMIMRQYNHILILVLPKLRWLDSYLRDHRVNFWAQVSWRGDFFNRDRGWVTMRFAEHNDFASSAFWEDVITMRFPDFPCEIKEKYKRLKRHSALMRNNHDELSERERIVINARDSGKTLMQIGDFIGVSHTMVRKIELGARQKEENVRKKKEVFICDS